MKTPTFKPHPPPEVDPLGYTDSDFYYIVKPQKLPTLMQFLDEVIAFIAEHGV